MVQQLVDVVQVVKVVQVVNVVPSKCYYMTEDNHLNPATSPTDEGDEFTSPCGNHINHKICSP